MRALRSSNKRLSVFLAGLVAAGSLGTTPAPARADASVSGGKSSLFVSMGGVSVPTCCTGPSATVVAGFIQRGKRRHVLSIDGTLTTDLQPGATPAPAISVRVNGFDIAEPSSFPSGSSRVIWNSCPQSRCTVSGHFFLDLDDAEARFPGAFIGQPLIVELRASDYAFAGFTADAVLRARLEKK